MDSLCKEITVIQMIENDRAGDGVRGEMSPGSVDAAEVRPRVRIATAEDSPELAATLALAFFDDPVVAWIVPDEAWRFDVMRGFFRVGLDKLWLKHGLVYTTQQRVAVSVWLPPGHAQASEEEAAEAMPGFEEAWGEYGVQFGRLSEVTEEHHPQELHYYLPLIGTQPGWRGLGLGSALLRPTLARCDDEGMPAYLEATTERNRALYERHGFVAIGPLELPDGPTMQAMWREPR
jgi:ribosomal protein S18 acetylase RimI-like enzyme